MAGKNEIDDFIAGLEAMMEDVDEESRKVLAKVSPIAVENLKRNVQANANRGYSTGDLAGSISSTTPRTNDIGSFIAVRPTGTNRHGVRNGEVLGYMEHGVPSRNIEPRPVLQQSLKQSEQALFDECEKMLEKLSQF